MLPHDLVRDLRQDPATEPPLDFTQVERALAPGARTGIACIADAHGLIEEFIAIANAIPNEIPVVQLGDLCLYPDWHASVLPHRRGIDWRTLRRPVLFLDGNHEWHPELTGLTSVTEVRPNLFYVPRGTVLTLDDRRVGFLGGAETRDRHTRIEGMTWFPEESIRYADQMRFADQPAVDLLLTHTPPAFAIQAMGGAPDPSSRAVEQVWDGLGRPVLVAGHMHVRHRIHQVHTLPELGVLLV